MNIEKTIKSLEKNRFKVTYFEQAEDAAKYLDEAIDGKVVGFGRFHHHEKHEAV